MFGFLTDSESFVDRSTNRLLVDLSCLITVGILHSSVPNYLFALPLFVCLFDLGALPEPRYY